MSSSNIFPSYGSPSVSSVNGQTGIVALVKADVGLGNVLNVAQIPATEKGADEGVATLGADGKIPSTQLPATAIAEVDVVADITARDALSPDEGDIAIVQDRGDGLAETYIWDGLVWQVLSVPTAGVVSVNARTGAVTLAKADVGLGNVLNAAQIPASDKGAVNGVATLGSDGKLTSTELPTISVLTVTAAPASDVSGDGVKISLTAGENLVFGDVLYLKSDGKVWKADADAAGAYPVIGMALASISAEASGLILLFGIARNDAWNWTVGGIVYLSVTAGGLTQTAPNATDNVVQAIGIATHADRILFKPDLIYITRT